MCLDALLADKSILDEYFNDHESALQASYNGLCWSTVEALHFFSGKIRDALISLEASNVPTLLKVVPVLRFLSLKSNALIKYVIVGYPIGVL